MKSSIFYCNNKQNTVKIIKNAKLNAVNFNT